MFQAASPCFIYTIVGNIKGIFHQLPQGILNCLAIYAGQYLVRQYHSLYLFSITQDQYHKLKNLGEVGGREGRI